MPVDYTCGSCRLRFSLGWFHYHDFSSGYGSATLCVCKKCGTRHCIEQALTSRGPEFLITYQADLTDFDDGQATVLKKELRKGHEMSVADVMRLRELLPLKLGSELPPHQAEETRDRYAPFGGVVELREDGREPSPNFGPIQQDQLQCVAGPSFDRDEFPTFDRTLPIQGEREGETGHFDLSLQACGHCGEVGSLRCAPFDEGPLPPCPNCGKKMLTESGGWVT